MSYRRHTKSSASSGSRRRSTPTLRDGLSEVAGSLNSPLFVSQSALPPEAETVATIE
ncbi:unnamed protein product, partial [Ostreobium quekettii]